LILNEPPPDREHLRRITWDYFTSVLGNYVVGDGGAFPGVGPRESCWSVFDEGLALLVGADNEPVPDQIATVLGGLPEACRAGAAVQIRPPAVLENRCPPGTIFAIEGSVEWSPGSPFAPPGEFTFRGYASSDTVNEVAFNTCLEIFDPSEDVASVEELVPVPVFGKSPEVTGLTGLDTWLWYDFSDPGSYLVVAPTRVERIVGLPIDLVATAWVDAVRWDMDGDGVWDEEVDIPDVSWWEPPGHEVYEAAGGGNSADEAAAVFVYETKGAYQVAVGVVWRGVYTVTTAGLGGVYEYPSVTRVETFEYRVCEVRSVMAAVGEDRDLPNVCLAP
jgi:hypothetical protein